MSSYSVVTAGFPGGPHTTPFRFEKPRRFQLDYSPYLGGYSQIFGLGTYRDSDSAGLISGEVYAYNEVSETTILIRRPILISHDVTTIGYGNPTATHMTLKRVYARYHRQNTADRVELRVIQVSRSTGERSYLVEYTNTEMSSTGGWGTLDEAVDLSIDERTYSYGIELSISPGTGGGITDARFGRVFLTVDLKGLRPVG
ncbi:MAG: hypothetical protein AAFV53_35280 [Myxococcota bacterium]